MSKELLGRLHLSPIEQKLQFSTQIPIKHGEEGLPLQIIQGTENNQYHYSVHCL